MPENTNNQDATRGTSSRSDRRLIERLTYNYEYLHRQYRLGNSDSLIGHTRQLNVNDDPESLKYFEFCAVSESSSKKPFLSFDSAINDLYSVVRYIEQERAILATQNGVLLLRCKCLVYEAADYILKVPEELGKYFVDFAETLPTLEKEIERLAENLNGGSFPKRDKRARVIKLLLMAAVWGANQLYREHIPHSYDRAFVILKKVDKVIRDVLPRQYDEPRESFGILGLAQYLTGRVLFRKGLIKESQQAFRRSADAYLARLRQKEEFFARGQIKPEPFEEKVSVTIRRAALVTAFGDGYHHFVGGQLTRALESLTLARAALTRNSGRIYLIYVDMLYWACRRARESSDPASVELCVSALRDCRKRFGEAIKDSHYFHRAGLQLALALFCRIRLTDDVNGPDFDEAFGYIDAAIEYSSRPTSRSDFVNPSLLSAALVIKSRLLRAQCMSGAETNAYDKHYEYLIEARVAAANAHEVVKEIKMVQTEASAALGEVHTDLAALHLVYRKQDFKKNFEAALEFFRRAITENNGRNLRNHAVCLLGLTRLCLLNPATEVAAREYFAEWKVIENLVEHGYCQAIAEQLEPKFSAQVLLIKLSDELNIREWQKRLRDKLIDGALERFWTKERLSYPPERWRKLLLTHLGVELGYNTTQLNKLIREQDLMQRVIALREGRLTNPAQPRTGKRIKPTKRA